jgi:hypothetical protein
MITTLLLLVALVALAVAIGWAARRQAALVAAEQKVALLVSDWRQAWKWLSVQAFVLVGVMPDLYNGIVAMGWLDDPLVPAHLRWALRILGGVGILLRLLNQQRKPPLT